MKKRVFILVCSICVLSVLLVACSAQEPAAPVAPQTPTVIYAGGEDSPTTGIVVSGSGSVNVTPDVAYVTLGVTTRAAEPGDAVRSNNELLETVIAVISGLGVADNDIRTQDFYMYPEYDYSYDFGGGEPSIRGYTVSNNITVTVRDIEIVGDVLGVAVDAGANASGGVTFGLLDDSEAYKQALAYAVENANGKAAAITASLGVELGSVVSVVESVNNYYIPYAASFRNEMALEDATGGSVPVQAGRLTVTADVMVNYSW